MNKQNEVKLIPFAISGIETMHQGAVLANFNELWKRGYTGQDTVTAIIDTGVDYTHPDLVGQVLDGKSFVDGVEDYKDDNGHGTHVAGIFGARSDGVGVFGGAYSSKILAIKVLNKDGSGSMDSIIQGIDYAINWCGENGEKVNVINMSLGCSGYILDFHLAIKRAVDANILVVCAAGNSGDDNADTDEFSYPAKFDECVSVSSMSNAMQMSKFTNTGDYNDLICVGEAVYSTFLNHGYMNLSGTSMATPLASAMACCLYSKFKEEYKRNPSEAELYAQLMKATTDIGLPKKAQGNGMLDAKPIFNSNNKTIKLKINELTYYVNGVKQTMDVTPFLDDKNRTQVPIRFVAEALGYEVEWESKTKTVVINNIIKLTIGDSFYMIGDTYYTMDTAPVLQDNRTFVPIRFVAEALGCYVSWDNPEVTIIEV